MRPEQSQLLFHTYHHISIWEKKYGKNANHRKVGLEAAKASCRGPRPDRDGPQNRVILNKTTPVPDHRVRHKDIPRHQPDTGWGQRTGTSPENMTSHTAAPPHRPQRPQLASRGEEQLHPSWEAKRKLKEKQNAGILPSQGTKIKFE